MSCAVIIALYVSVYFMRLQTTAEVNNRIHTLNLFYNDHIHMPVFFLALSCSIAARERCRLAFLDCSIALSLNERESR